MLGKAFKDASHFIELLLLGQIKVTDNGNDEGVIQLGAKLILAYNMC